MEIGAKQSETVTCEKHGEYVTDLSLHMREMLGKLACPQCKEEQTIESERYNRECDEREARDRAKRLLDAVGLPLRFREKSFDDYYVHNDGQKRALALTREYVENFTDHRKSGRCLVMMGKTGTGKTHLACSIAKALYTSHHVCYRTVAEAIRELRDTWRKDSDESETQVLKRLFSPSLLILDEVGVQTGSDTDVRQLTELIDLRYGDMKPTIVISNQDVAGLTQYLGDRAVDRLRENGGIVASFNWDSERKA
jgi:DNA replication protein DnaC